MPALILWFLFLLKEEEINRIFKVNTISPMLILKELVKKKKIKKEDLLFLQVQWQEWALELLAMAFIQPVKEPLVQL